MSYRAWVWFYRVRNWIAWLPLRWFLNIQIAGQLLIFYILKVF